MSKSMQPFVHDRTLTDAEGGGDLYVNDRYHAIVRRTPSSVPDDPALIHLSIRNNDRSARHDWREFQQIKNELVGTDIEMVELYPAESRLVDLANQFHLWGIDDPSFRFPFGFSERMKGSRRLAKAFGAEQR